LVKIIVIKNIKYVTMYAAEQEKSVLKYFIIVLLPLPGIAIVAKTNGENIGIIKIKRYLTNNFIKILIPL